MEKNTREERAEYAGTGSAYSAQSSNYQLKRATICITREVWVPVRAVTS